MPAEPHRGEEVRLDVIERVAPRLELGLQQAKKREAQQAGTRRAGTALQARRPPCTTAASQQPDPDASAVPATPHPAAAAAS